MKKRTMNELRQTKEYKLSDQGGTYTVPYKGADPVQQVLAQQIEELAEHDKPSKSFIEDQEAAKQNYNWSGEKITLVDVEQEELDKAAAEGSKEFFPEEIKEIRNKLNYTLNEQMQEIAEIVAPTIHDVIFQEIIEVMDNYDELNWGYFVQDDAPTALLDACMDHKTEIHYEIFQLVLQKLK